MPGNEPINQSSQDALQSSGQYLRNELAQIIKQAICDVIDSVNISQTENYVQALVHRNLDDIIDASCFHNFNHCRGSHSSTNTFSLASLIPNIGLIVREHCEMICHIGCLYNKKEHLTKDVIAIIILTATDPAVGEKFLQFELDSTKKKKISESIFDQILDHLSDRQLHQISKTSIGCWLPEVEANILIGWSNSTTRLIGRMAKKIFENKIQDLEEPVHFDEYLAQSVKQEEYENSKLSIEKMRIFVALMQIDRNIHPTEVEFIRARINAAPIGNEDKRFLHNRIMSDVPGLADRTILNLDRHSAIGLLLDMIGLAHCDNMFHPLERLYIKQIGLDLGVSERIIDDMLNEDILNTIIGVDSPNNSQKPEAIDPFVEEINRKIISHDPDICVERWMRPKFRSTVQKIIEGKCPELINELTERFKSMDNSILARWYIDLLFHYKPMLDGVMPSGSSWKLVNNINAGEEWNRGGRGKSDDK